MAKGFPEEGRMRRVIIVAVVLVALAMTAYGQDEESPQIPEDMQLPADVQEKMREASTEYGDWESSLFGHYRMESVSTEGTNSYQYVEVIVSYVNTTGKTFDSVTFRASVYNRDDRIVATNRRSFFAHAEGPIRPGFEGVVEIPVEVDHSQAHAVGVTISGN